MILFWRGRPAVATAPSVASSGATSGCCSAAGSGSGATGAFDSCDEPPQPQIAAVTRHITALRIMKLVSEFDLACIRSHAGHHSILLDAFSRHLHEILVLRIGYLAPAPTRHLVGPVARPFLGGVTMNSCLFRL